MSEINSSSQIAFPERSHLDRGREMFMRDYQQVLRIWEQQSGDFEVRSELPEVVGAIPQSERDAFSSLHRAEFLDDHGRQFRALWKQDMIEEFPGICEIIDEDLRSLGISSTYGNDETPATNLLAEFTMTFTEAGQSPIGGNWHIDGLQNNRSEHPGIRYVFSDNHTTEFYEGAANVHHLANSKGGHSTDLNSLSVPQEASGIPAPDFAIVRLNPFSVHRSPHVQEHTARTFARVTVYPE